MREMRMRSGLSGGGSHVSGNEAGGPGGVAGALLFAFSRFL